MNYAFFIGIDVSKNTLDFAVSEGKELLLQTLSLAQVCSPGPERRVLVPS
jgi:hypothetical protein